MSAIKGERRLSGNHTGLYRVRRGIWGKAVLQECIDYPAYIGGKVDSSTRDFVWHFTKPEIEFQEIYRFCLVKNIPLEECVIPDSPYEINHQQEEEKGDE